MKWKNKVLVVIVGFVLILFFGTLFLAILDDDPSVTIRENSYIAHEITSECDNGNIRYCKITYYENGTYRSCIKEGYFLNPNKKDVRIYFKGDDCGTSMISFKPSKAGFLMVSWLITAIVAIIIYIRCIPLMMRVSSKK